MEISVILAKPISQEQEFECTVSIPADSVKDVDSQPTNEVEAEHCEGEGDCVSNCATELELTTHTPDQIKFTVGESFKSFDELETKIKQYEMNNFVQLWKRDTRKIEAAQKRLNRILSKKIKYYEIVYCCIHDGRMFKSIGEGKRSTS